MIESMSIVNSIRSAAAQAIAPATAKAAPATGSEFARVLRQRLDEKQIVVSAHAADRMIRRGLIPDEHAISQLQSAFDIAEQRGSREALFLLDNLAVIAAVPTRTVKTAMGRDGLEAGVFTNIDAAIVMSGAQSEENKDNKSTPSPRSIGRTSTEGAAIQHGGLFP
jgi:flagellar operon protein